MLLRASCLRLKHMGRLTSVRDYWRARRYITVVQIRFMLCYQQILKCPMCRGEKGKTKLGDNVD
jgi:hypothetical protein